MSGRRIPRPSCRITRARCTSKNITTFLAHLLGKDGAAQATLPINPDDEITRETLLTRGGEVVHARVRAL